MLEKELELLQGSLRYKIEDERVIITGYNGMASELVIPQNIENYSVVGIGKKAFLSKKHLRRVVLPAGIESVGEWAFAYCSALEEVVLGTLQPIIFGRAVFLDCPNLQKITIPSQNEDIAYLMAAVVSKMDAYYLLDVVEAGSAEWLGKWDARMLTLLHTPDQDGYSKQVLCGEEDYGSTDFQAYLNIRRKSKVRLLLTRLLHPCGLTDELREELEAYLRAHTSGCDSEESWEVIHTEHGEDRACYELFASMGCVHEKNLDGILADIGERYPEMKAYFMRVKAEQIGYEDFFGNLSLDL